MVKFYSFIRSRIQSIELRLANKIQQRITEAYDSSIFYFNLVYLNVALIFLEILADSLKFLIIIFSDPGVGFNIFFKQRELRSCPFSYFNYKNIQSRIRLFSAAGVATIVFVAVTTSLITNFMFGGKRPSVAATFSYIQTKWLSQTANSAQHDIASGTPEANWTQYASKDSLLGIMNGGEDLQLLPSVSTSTQTNLADFLAGTFDANATTSGSGAAGKVVLASNQPVATPAIRGSLRSNCALTGHGTLYCWGLNTNGQVGDNTNSNRIVPVRVLKGQAAAGDTDGTYLTNVVVLGASYVTSCVVTGSGNAYCWGDNSRGTVGDNTAVDKWVPTRVLKGQAAASDTDGTYLTNVKTIVNSANTCAVTNAGNVYCWGTGRLGDGSSWSTKYTPARVVKGEADASDTDGTYLTNIRSIATGQNNLSCASSNSGNVYCWGAEPSGGLGNGGALNETKDAPTKVLKGGAVGADFSGAYLANIKEVSLTRDHSCSLSNSGNVYCWGNNNYGQLGNATTTDSGTPVKVQISNVSKLVAGDILVCAITTAAAVYCWGGNPNLQLGDGTSVNSRTTPVQVVKGAATGADISGAYLTNVGSITTGISYSCATTNSGNAYCWGSNSGYGFGDGFEINSASSPVLVHGVGNVGSLFVNYVTTYNSPATFTSGLISMPGGIGTWQDLSWLNSTGQTIAIKVRSGMPAGSLVSTSTTYTINSTDSTAWQNSGGSLPMPSDGAWQEASAGDKANVATSNSSFWETKMTSAHDQYDMQLYRFKNTASVASTTNLTVNWQGYGENRGNYDVYLYIWNRNSSAWEQMDTANLPASGNLTGTISSNLTNYIDGSNYVFVAAAAKHYNYQPVIANTGRLPVHNSSIGTVSSTTLSWSVWSDLDNDTPEYYVQLFANNNCSGGPVQTRNWNAGASWDVAALSVDTIYSWQVKARSSFAYSDDTTYNGCYVFSTNAGAPVNGVCGAANGTSYSSAPTNNLCSAGTASVVTGTGPWNWTCLGLNGGTNSGQCTALYSAGYVANNGICEPGEENLNCLDSQDCGTCKPSCPYVYAWTGEKFEYQNDLESQVSGLPYLPYYGKYPGLFDFGKIVPKDGKYLLNIRETLPEADYFDKLALWVVDVPSGYDVMTNWSHSNDGTDTKKGMPENYHGLFTIKGQRTPIKAFDKDGKNVTVRLQAVDDNPVIETMTETNFYTVDFGEVKHPEYAKLIIYGWTKYDVRPNFVKGTLRQSSIEVLNKQGKWEQVKVFGESAGDLKPFVVDLANIWKTGDHRLRITPAYSKTSTMVIDKLELDDSAPVPVKLQKVDPLAADLHFRGSDRYDYPTLGHRLHADNITKPNIATQVFYGEFTKYGQVTPLLLQNDDKFVAMRHGDELSLEFPVPAESAGFHRKVFLYGNVYYIGMNSMIDKKKIRGTITQLPFNGMINYPYDPAVENYPNDQDHLDYVKQWNTRVCEKDKDYCQDKNSGEKISAEAKADKKLVPKKDDLSWWQQWWIEAKHLVLSFAKKRVTEELQPQKTVVAETYDKTQAGSIESAASSSVLRRSLNTDNVELVVTSQEITGSEINWVNDWAACNSTTNSGGVSMASLGCIRNGDSYLQYQAILSTASTTVTPSLDEVNLTYSSFPASQELISSPYNTGSIYNLIGSIGWQENLPAGTFAALSIRSGIDLDSLLNNDWTTFQNGVTVNCSKVGNAVSCPANALPSIFKDGEEDQWFQYRVTLGSSGINTPTVGQISVGYVVNNPPSFDAGFGVQASEYPDGSVGIQYMPKDSDTTSASEANRGLVQPSFEYSLDNGNNWSPLNFGLSAGATTTKAVDEAQFGDPNNSFAPYVATWTPRSILNGTYSATAKIRVTINDREAANNLASLASASFILDLKAPEPAAKPMIVRATSTPAQVTLSVSDDSAVKMRLGLTPDLSAVSWSDYNDNTVLDVTGAAVAYVQFKDVYNNISSVQSVEVPIKPSGLMIQDTSNMRLDVPEYRLFIAWKKATSSNFKQYHILRSTDGNSFSVVNTISDQLVNYFAESTMAPDALVYYKLAVEDNDGNVSEYSETISAKANGVQDEGEGGGGSLPGGTPPNIFNVATSSVFTTEATISWETEELSSSLVEYITLSGGDFTDAPSQGVATMLNREGEGKMGKHVVVLRNLEPGTTYYFQIKSTDQNGLIGTSKGEPDGHVFTTQAGPKVLSDPLPAASEIHNNSAVIAWQTDQPADSYVVFSTSTELLASAEIGNGEATTIHSVVLNGLDPGTRYYFFVKSGSARGYRDASQGGLQYYEFVTTKDTVAPTIGQVSVSKNDTSATISWRTNEAASTTVGYRLSTEGEYTYLENNNFNFDHAANPTGLLPDKQYLFAISNADINGNVSVLYQGDFTTLLSPDVKSPVIATSSIIVLDTSLNSATIYWDTDEESSSYVQLSDNEADFNTTYKEIGINNAVTNHTVLLDGLLQGKKYYYRVRSADVSGNEDVEPQLAELFDFSTQEGPIISNVSKVTDSGSATISWATNQLSDSTVIYATSSDFSASLSKSLVNLTLNHSLVLGQLQPGQYYYKVKSTTAAGASTMLASTSPTFSFVIDQDSVAPQLLNISHDNVTDVTAVIIWNTDELADSRVEYRSASGTYTLAPIKSSLSIDHSIILAGLATSTTYYYRVASADMNGNIATSTESDLQRFVTRGILLNEQQVADREAALRAETEELKNQLIQASSTDQSNNSQVLELQRQITALESQIANQGQQGGGIMIVDKIDKVAPIISEVHPSEIKSDSAVIGWTTNEEANSFVRYGLENVYDRSHGDYVDTKNHSVKIDNLLPDKKYNFQVASQDSSGNLTTSRDFDFMTPSLAAQLKKEGKTDEEIADLVEAASQSDEGKENILIQAAQKAMEIMRQLASQVSLGSLESTALGQHDMIEKLASAIPGPILGGEPTVVTGATTANISWTTDKDANSLVAYAPEGVYIKSAGDDGYLQVVGDANNLTTKHLARIAGLKPNTIYHFQLRSKAQLGAESRSRDFTFKTKEEGLEILTHGTEIKNSMSAIFRWSTNQEASTKLVYTPYRSNKLAVEEKKELEEKSFTIMHESVINDLESGVVYQVSMQSQNKKGQLVEEVIEQFTASEDDLPPTIGSVQTESALSQGKQLKVQSIISWQTNEPTVGQVQYIKGVVTDDKEFQDKTPLETTYSRKHVAVVTKFDSGQVYTFRITATDSSGNLATSKIYTILTPKQKESVFQLILKNFEDIFGWVGKVGN